MLNVIRKTLFASRSIFKRLNHAKNIGFGTVFVMKTVWSFGFVSLGIVLNFVLRYSNFSPAKEDDDVGPFQGPSSSHRFYRWSLTGAFGFRICFELRASSLEFPGKPKIIGQRTYLVPACPG